MNLRERLTERGLLNLAETICQRHDVRVDDLDVPRGCAAVAAARHEIWAELYARGHWSTTRIGELFDRDHTTVIAGLRKVRDQRQLAALADRDSQIRAAAGLGKKGAA